MKKILITLCGILLFFHSVIPRFPIKLDKIITFTRVFGKGLPSLHSSIPMERFCSRSATISCTNTPTRLHAWKGLFGIAFWFPAVVSWSRASTGWCTCRRQRFPWRERCWQWFVFSYSCFLFPRLLPVWEDSICSGAEGTDLPLLPRVMRSARWPSS